MRLASRLLAVTLAYCVAVHPTVASAQAIQVQAGAAQAGVPVVPAALSGFQSPGSISSGLQAPSLTPSVMGALPSVKSAPAAVRVSPVSSIPSAPSSSLNHSVSVAVSPSPVRALPVSEPVVMVAADAASPAAMPLTLTRVSASGAAAVQGRAVGPIGTVEGRRPVPDRASTSKRLAAVSAEVAEAGRDLPNLSGASAHEAVGRQFRALTGEQVRSSAADAADPVAAPEAPALSPTARLRPASEAGQAEAKAEVPKAKAPISQVFKDPARNKAFWRYTYGFVLFMLGLEMYSVALPFLISSFTRNTLSENHDQRLANADAVKTLIRENRSFARIAHYAAQGLSYLSIPLFSSDDSGNAKKWLVKSFLIRSVIIFGIPTIFFASGLFSLHAALWTLFGLIAVQSFFQGISVTMDSAVTAQITGDKSVTDAERIRANSIFTFLGALTAIIGPAIAGQISLIKDHFGKAGIGSAILYGIYGIFVGLAGLTYATIRLVGPKAKAAGEAQAAKDGEAKADAPKPTGLRGVFQTLWGAMGEGVKLLVKNRFLRTMMIMTLIVSLFSDPLVFNVLPEYVESVLTANPATLGFLMNIPVVGWVLHGMMSTPTGYFSLLVVFSSVGSILASLLIAPARKLLARLGMKTEESQVRPFYLLAMLEAPLFWLMCYAHSALAVVTLYGLQTFVTTFATMLLSGLQQKAIGNYTPDQMNKVLAAESILGIVATIASTYFYGFILGNIPIATSMLIAAVAITVMAAFRIVAPWLYFTKDQRSGKASVHKA